MYILNYTYSTIDYIYLLVYNILYIEKERERYIERERKRVRSAYLL